MELDKHDLENIAFEGIKVDFQFQSDQPTFGDLFLIVGFENPNFPPEQRQFEQLQDLGFEQIDDFFGIKNEEDTGDEVLIWMSPIVNKEEVFHHPGPFNAIRLTYVIVRNDPQTIDLFEQVFHAFQAQLRAKPVFKGQSISDFESLKQIINQTIEYCRNELGVEPGSDAALDLEW